MERIDQLLDRITRHYPPPRSRVALADERDGSMPVQSADSNALGLLLAD